MGPELKAQRQEIRRILNSGGELDGKGEQQCDRTVVEPAASATTGISAAMAGGSPSVQRSESEEPEEELRLRPDEEEKEPVQAQLIQRVADTEEEKSLQTKLVQRQLHPGAQLSRFGYAGPAVKAQQARIGRILRSIGAQAKLTIGQPNDKYEQEADRVADHMLAMPDPALQRQPENEEEDETLRTKPLADQITPLVQRKEESPEEEEEPVQAKEQPARTPQVTPNIESRINSLKDGGQPLDTATRSFFEPRFGHDFSHVRVHTDSTAANTARSINARAFTVGNHVAMGSGEYQPNSQSGQRLLGHELTHVVQQNSGKAIQRNPDITPNLERLRQLLQNDDEESAIELMGKLSNAEIREILSRREFKELAISAFNNDEMYRGIRAMRGDLYPSLEWMFDEGTDWEKARDVITRATTGKDRVRSDNWMKDQFVGICNDEEMAEAVDLLGGTLLQKFKWMKAEGSNWSLAKARLKPVNDPENLVLYNNDQMKDFFASICNDEEMAEAVDLLGGTLLQKFKWMKAEGSNWSLAKARLKPVNDPENLALYTNDQMRDFFVSICNDEEMAEAVDLLGGTLLQKFKWMKVEGSNWALVKARLKPVNDPENLALYTNDQMRDFFVSVCNDEEMVEAVDLLGGTLLQKLKWILEEGTSYGSVKPVIVAATAPDKAVALANQPLLRAIQKAFNWDDFARTVELLGRLAPTGAGMIGDATVQAALAAAWAASSPAVTIWPAHNPAFPAAHPCNPPVAAPPAPGVGHEEGGFIYMNLITGMLLTKSVAAGGQASLRLSNPPEVKDSIVVGGYHTHPNVGPCWGAPFASGDDIAWATGNGVPLLLRGAFPVLAATSDVFTGPRRLHLAGNRGLPGPGGGLAPQATIDGSYDEV